MKARDLIDLVLLGALWGASFLFMRLGAHEFGPVALVFLRVAGASILLLPWMCLRKESPALRQHWRPVAVVGLVNSTGPFLLGKVILPILFTVRIVEAAANGVCCFSDRRGFGFKPRKEIGRAHV